MADTSIRLVRAVIAPRSSEAEFVIEEQPSGQRRQINFSTMGARPSGLIDKWWEAILGEVKWQKKNT